MPSLCLFFNSWPLFIQKYNLAFSPHHNLDLSPLQKSRNLTSLLWLTPILFLTLAFTSVNNLVYHFFLLEFLYNHYQTINVLGSRALSYVKDFLLLQTLKTAYVELRKGIQNEYGRHQKSISKEQVRAWWELVILIRLQTKRVESHISLHNLWSIFEVFAMLLMLLSMVVFLAMNGVLVLSGGVEGSNFLPLLIIFSALLFSSLYWKTELADRITQAVNTSTMSYFK